MSRWCLLLAAPLAIAIADHAAACTPDPCADVVAFTTLEPALDVEVPFDGVLVMQANWFGELETPDLLTGLSLTVRRADLVVAGAIESTDIPGLLVWRPAEPLQPGEVYAVTGSLANTSDVPTVCAATEVQVDFEFTTTTEPAEPLVAPVVKPSVQYDATPLFRLDTLACCDDATPSEPEYCGISNGPTWSRGMCTPTLARARITVQLRVPSDVGEATAGQWVRTLIQDGAVIRSTLGTSFTRNLTEPTCFAIEQRSLATGETLTSEPQCFTEDMVQPIEDVALDPLETLAGPCVSDPYICEVVDGAWNMDACTTVVPPSSGGCSVGDPDAALGWLALGLLARRRRRPKARAQSRIRPTTAVVQLPRLAR